MGVKIENGARKVSSFMYKYRVLFHPHDVRYRYS